MGQHPFRSQRHCRRQLRPTRRPCSSQSLPRPDALQQLVAALQNRGLRPEAIEKYKQTLALNPNFARARKVVGRRPRRSSDWTPRRHRSSSKAVAISPSLLDASSVRPDALAKSDSRNRRVAKLQEALHIALISQRPHREAAPLFRSPPRRCRRHGGIPGRPSANPSLDWLYNNWGAALQNRGLRPEAIEKYKQTLALNPNFARAQVNWANALKDQSDWTSAIDHYSKAVAISPSLLDAYVGWADALAKSGAWMERSLRSRKALHITTRSAGVHRSMGATSFSINNDVRRR